MKRIVVLGDSHSQLFANNPNFRRGLWIDPNLEAIFDVRWLGPVTYWRLCRDQETFINLTKPVSYTPYPGMTVTTACEYDQEVIISLGEIDIRSNILKYNPTNFVEGIDNMLDKISTFINNNKQHAKLHLLSIIPPIRSADCQSPN